MSTPPVAVVEDSKSICVVESERKASENGTLPPLFAPELRIALDAPARSRLPFGVSVPVVVSEESHVRALVMLPPLMARSPSIDTSITPAPMLLMASVVVPALLLLIAGAVPVPRNRSSPFAVRSPVEVMVVDARIAPVTSSAAVGCVVFTPTRLVSPFTRRTFVSTARLACFPGPTPATKAAVPPHAAAIPPALVHFKVAGDHPAATVTAVVEPPVPATMFVELASASRNTTFVCVASQLTGMLT